MHDAVHVFLLFALLLKRRCQLRCPNGASREIAAALPAVVLMLTKLSSGFWYIQPCSDSFSGMIVAQFVYKGRLRKLEVNQNIGALIIRIRFWARFCYIYRARNPQNSTGNCFPIVHGARYTIFTIVA